MRTLNNVWMPTLMNDIMEESFPTARRVRTTTPAVNVIESEKDYILELAIPGITKEMTTIELKDDTLSVKIEKKQESSEKGDDNTRWLRHEFSYGSYEQAFTLPEDVEADGISANVANGILSINLPKKQVRKAPEARLIEVL